MIDVTTQIEPAKANDHSITIRFLERLTIETTPHQPDTHRIAAGSAEILKNSDHGEYFHARRSGRIVGQFLLSKTWNDVWNGYDWILRRIYIRREVRGLGILDAMLDHVRQLAERAETPPLGIELVVAQHNARAIRAYCKREFETDAFRMKLKVTVSGQSICDLAASA